MIERRKFIASLAGAAASVPLFGLPKGAHAAEEAPGSGETGAIISDPPGTLLRKERIPTSIKNAQAWKVRYVTRDVNGLSHECSGLIIASDSEGKDRPIMTWCHGTTGLGDAACPSAPQDPACNLNLYFTAQSTHQIDFGVPGLQDFIDAGWVVVSTDYQGLGTKGMHQYMVNRTNALDAVFIAHAARKLEVGAGTKMGCIGWSQGGGAAAAVAELDEADYGDLDLVGTVTMSPSVAKIILDSPKGGPTSSLTNHDSESPSAHGAMMFFGIHASNPSALKLSDVFTPLGVEILETAWNTQPVHHLGDTFARLYRLKGPVFKPVPPNYEAWKEAITAGSAGMRKPVCPVLVCIDGLDGGTVQPDAWQQAYADKVKEFGGTAEVKVYPKDDHFALPDASVGAAREFLTALL